MFLCRAFVFPFKTVCLVFFLASKSLMGSKKVVIKEDNFLKESKEILENLTKTIPTEKIFSFNIERVNGERFKIEGGIFSIDEIQKKKKTSGFFDQQFNNIDSLFTQKFYYKKHSFIARNLTFISRLFCLKIRGVMATITFSVKDSSRFFSHVFDLIVSLQDHKNRVFHVITTKKRFWVSTSEQESFVYKFNLRPDIKDEINRVLSLAKDAKEKEGESSFDLIGNIRILFHR